MNQLFLILITCFLALPFYSFGQQWTFSETTVNDTIFEIQTYVDSTGTALEDSTGTHKIVRKYFDHYFGGWKRFDLAGNPAEDARGIHRKEKFWKYFKFFAKDGSQLKTVKDSYQYDHGDATYCIYSYNELGNLVEVAYFKDGLVVGNAAPTPIKAVGAYKGMTHRFVYRHSRGSKTIKEFLYAKDGHLQDIKIFKKNKAKKKQKK